MSEPVVLPSMTGPLGEAWVAILEIAERLPDHWALIGGQMVLLHCWERGRPLARPTTDGDAVLDVRAVPAMLDVFTRVLRELGFTSAGVSPSGHEHRWLRGQAQIDVLIPDNVGERAAARTGATGSTTIRTPGGLEALEYSRPVAVRMGDQRAEIPRPHLAGALLAKARAHGVFLDRDRDRHLLDAAILASMLERRDLADLAAITAKPKRQRTLTGLLARLSEREDLWAGVEGASDGIERLRTALAQ